jgi:hypothetical protein
MNDHLIGAQKTVHFCPGRTATERNALRWAEIAGLVDLYPDGSWLPTREAMARIARNAIQPGWSTGGENIHAGSRLCAREGSAGGRNRAG